MKKMILGVFSDKIEAEHAIEELEIRGYNPKDMSIVMKDKAYVKVTSASGENIVEGTASGIANGAVIGGLAGLLIGLGTIVIPGVGGLLIGGPIAAALGLTGVAATTVSGALTGALAGGLFGALVGLGIPEEQARIYEDVVRGGGILVAISTKSSNEPQVRSILEEHGADQVRTISQDDNYVGRRDSYEYPMHLHS